MEPYIDAHSHIWTPDVAHYPLAPGFTVADMQPHSFTAEELLAHCRPAGVGRVNLIQMSFYGSTTRYMLDMIKLYPDRFVGTAIVDPLGPTIPGKAMRELGRRGRRGVPDPAAATASTRRRAGSSRPVTPRCSPRPPRPARRSRCLIDPDGFPEVDRMCRRFPDTTVIIDHLGRIGAGPDGAIRDADVEALCALAKHPKVFVKVGAFYALGKKTPPYLDLAPLIRRVVQAFGAQRCMWESDCPFQVVKDRYLDSLALVRDRLDFLGKDDRDWLLFRTAEQTLFRPIRS